MAQAAPIFKIKHIGINTPDDASAQALTGQICGLFEVDRGHENETHIFAGESFEVMKHDRIGEHGHIALQTEDVEAAMAFLASKGITFRESTARKDADGKINFIYLEQEIGGFALHLTK